MVTVSLKKQMDCVLPEPWRVGKSVAGHSSQKRHLQCGHIREQIFFLPFLDNKVTEKSAKSAKFGMIPMSYES